MKLKAPIVGNLWTMFSMAQLSRTLATLLQGGIPLVAALEVAREASGNRVIARLDRGAISAGSGRTGRCPTAGADAGIFRISRLEMIRVGEQTGSLPDMLNHVADFYDEDVNIRSTALLSWVEPVILMFVAVFIAAYLISLYMPIFSLGKLGTAMKEVIENKEQRPRRLRRQLAERYRYEFVELKGVHLDLELFHSIQVDLMFRYNFVPLRIEGNALVVAMADPSDLVVIDEVSALARPAAHHQGRSAFRNPGPA